MMKRLLRDWKEGRHLLQAAGLVMGLLFLLLAEPLWRVYVDVNDLGPGGVGSAAADSTPEARSVAGLEALERFTILEHRTDYTDEEHAWIGDELYYIVTLESGERVAVRSNYENAVLIHEEGVEGYWYRYAVGTWRPWDLTAEERTQAEALGLSRTDCYADMAGNHLTALTESQFKNSCRTVCLVIAFLFFIVYGVYRQTRQERKDQEERDASLPRNDLERWIAGTYAIWGQFFAQVAEAAGKMAWDDALKKGPIHFGGRPKDEASRKLTCGVLLDIWDIRRQRDLLETVEYMSRGPGFQHCRDQAGRAWELCRAMQLLGMSYIAGWCSREEMLRRSCAVGEIMQETFRSWEELCESFLEGYARWRFDVFPEDAEQNVQVRREIYEGLQRRPDSPYRLNWYLPLDPDEWERRERRRQEVAKNLEGRR